MLGMKFLHIRIYVNDISVLCYNEKGLEAVRKRIYYAVLGLSGDPVRVVCPQLTANRRSWGRK
jgi:ribosome recycling factor